SGLVWPRWATPSSPSGLAENTTVIASTAETLSALELVNPSRFSVQIKMSNQWTKQTDFNAEAAVVHEINRAIGSAVDFVCINGTSGLLNLSQNTGDASTVTQNLAYLGAGQTFGGAPTWQTRATFHTWSRHLHTTCGRLQPRVQEARSSSSKTTKSVRIELLCPTTSHRRTRFCSASSIRQYWVFSACRSFQTLTRRCPRTLF